MSLMSSGKSAIQSLKRPFGIDTKSFRDPDRTIKWENSTCHISLKSGFGQTCLGWELLDPRCLAKLHCVTRETLVLLQKMWMFQAFIGQDSTYSTRTRR